MATRKANLNGMHTSGIYADMTVDGPKIGTLVVVVDRAKNLPNRRTMGKQDPYCAARLGKEAKKTTTDRRGGQVPKWWVDSLVNPQLTNIDLKFRDQELRFTVHDSPDYYNLKVSIFNDDKKTELIGETWVSLADVIVPGGGQSDTWHNLNFRGKYAGEVRMELTYYDSRPKPEQPASEQPDSAGHLPVKRRPLPSNPGGPRSRPLGFESEPRPLPSATGPREFGTPSRRQLQAQSRSAGNTPGWHDQAEYDNNEPLEFDQRRPLPQPKSFNGPDAAQQYQQYNERDTASSYASENDPYCNDPPRSDYDYPASVAGSDLPLGLPELPPMSSSGQSRFVRSTQEPPQQQRGDHQYPSHPELQHSYSAPAVPVPEPQPYDDRPMPHLDHTQSDSVLDHGQPVQLYQPYEPPAQESPAYYDQGQEYASVLYNEPQQDIFPPMEQYHHHEDPFDLSTQYYEAPYHPQDENIASEVFEAQAPPPPPAHKSQNSTPTYLPYRKPVSDQDIAPAPLNIAVTALARSSPMQQSSAVDLRSEPTSSPHSYHSYTSSQHDPYYSQSPSHPPDNFGRTTTQLSASSGGSFPRYSQEFQQNTSPDGPHQIHRKSMSQPRNAYSPSSYNTPSGTNPSVPPRDHRMSVPYLQQSSPLDPGPTSPYSQDQPSPLVIKTPPHRQTPPRPHTMYSTPPSGPYQASPGQNYNTPPRRHPLSQQQNAANISPKGNQYSSPPENNDFPPLIKPQPLSLAPNYARESRAANRSTPTTRKSVSPRPPDSTERRSEVPFGPDSYDQFNPSARSTPTNKSTTTGPNTPATKGYKSNYESPYSEDDGPIVDFHGNKIDPSDRLPESSWAPEPEKKIPVKVKPLRERERLNGARPRASPESQPAIVPAHASAPQTPSQYISQRAREPASASPLLLGAPPDSSPAATAATAVGRNKLRKANAGARPHSMAALPQSAAALPFGPIPSPAGGAAPPRASLYANAAASKSAYHVGALQRAPPVPAKIPLDDMAVLSAEISRIDIGPSSAPGSGARERARRRLLGFRE